MLTKIFVEGIADHKFISDFISYHFNVVLDKNDIIISNGWTNIYSDGEGELFINEMNKNSSIDGRNIMIFDADSDYNNRLTEINQWRINNQLEFEIFLFPNNSGPGDLETVLENIINKKNAAIFDCWDKYETCLSKIQIEGRVKPLTIPAKKTKIYGYLETLALTYNDKVLAKEEKRDYKNSKNWNLDSEYLLALKDFLSPYFS
ncbi:MAG: hypothetical protein HXX14_09275 [Bacteroidetes bacterium]|nr:hypothetical protein [Bacteroidota bacterium]